MAGTVVTIFSSFLVAQHFYSKGVVESQSATGTPQPSTWAFEETFNGTPTSPSQNLLPKRFDYVVTHREAGTGQDLDGNTTNRAFPADHRMEDCKAAANAGPISGSNPLLQHTAHTNHISDTANPDKSGQCRNCTSWASVARLTLMFFSPHFARSPSPSSVMLVS